MNTVKLYWRPNQKFELEINSQVCKDDFTSAGFTDVIGEVNDFLTGSNGVARLSGSYDSTSETVITYITADPTPASFDGSVGWRVEFVDQRP